MIVATKGHILLTLDDVHAWRKEQADIDQMVAELYERRDALARKLDAATLFLPADTVSEAGSTPTEAPSREEVENEDPPQRIRGGLVSPRPMPVLVYSLFDDGAVLLPSEAVQQIVSMDGVGGPLSAIKNNVYTALQRLTQRGQLQRTPEGAYTLPSNRTLHMGGDDSVIENEAPIGDAEGASETGEVAASPIENRHGFRLVG